MEELSAEEVSLALRCINIGKASGPSEVTYELFVIAGEQGSEKLCLVFNNILKMTLHLKSGLKALHSAIYKKGPCAGLWKVPRAQTARTWHEDLRKSLDT